MNEATTKPTVLSVAGSDCSGLAGIQMDIRTIAGIGAHAATAITAVTAQNSHTVLSTNAVSDSAFEAQLSAVADLDIQAVKSGLLVNALQVQALAHFVQKHAIPLIVDPVIRASSGSCLLYTSDAADE